MKVLVVRSGESMDLARAAIERFGMVEAVCVYIIKELAGAAHRKYHLDCVALQTAVPFLSGLPELQCCFFGGDYISYTVYDAAHEKDYDQPNANEKYARFIESVCNAYDIGMLSQNVGIEGLVPCCSPCPFRGIHSAARYRISADCELCCLIARHYPLRHMLACLTVRCLVLA